MAGKKKIGDKWYARIRFGKHVGNPFQVKELVPLETTNETVASIRQLEVTKLEKEIKKGIKFNFPWSSESGSIEVKPFTLKDAINEWNKKRVGKVSMNTSKTNRYGLKYLSDCLGHSITMKSITNKDIDKYKDFLFKKGLSNTSINIHLVTIKAMFNFHKKVENIDKLPLIEKIKIKKSTPKYITDDEFKKIQEMDELDDFYKRIFYFYRETGMRLREPMMSTLNGDWIDIPDESKNGYERNIECDNHVKEIFIEFKEWLDNGYGSTLKDCGDHLSKKFKKALRKINAPKNKSFHSLRHTFAVRHIIKGTHYNRLKLMMGHSSITTTEVYINMNMKRVEHDFPDLIKSRNFHDKNNKWDVEKWDVSDAPSLYVS